MKGKGLFRSSLMVLRAARALVMVALIIIVISSTLRIFGYKSIYVDEQQGKLKFAIPNLIAIGSQAIALKITLQLEDVVMLNQVTKMISKEPKRISPFFETEARILNPTLFQISLAIVVHIFKVLASFLVLHFMVRIMKNVMKNEVLSLLNNFYLKVIASIIIIVPPLCGILEAINVGTIQNYLAGSNVRVENNLGVYVSNSLNLESLIFVGIGGFVYLLAKVQEYGLKLKEENDLTV
ncbi:MAG: DUF2975 domain-containing protein [Ignavibacteria bacterium]|nr:DUF2975 domain-containing protein [Ignavibacteria bacterium]